MARSASDGQKPRTEELDEFADHAFVPKHLRNGEDQDRWPSPLPASCPLSLKADHFRQQHRYGLSEHATFSFNATDSPTDYADAINHRGVGVGADQSVRICLSGGFFVKTTLARYSRFTW